MKAVALNLMKFFEDESCGQCTPCRVGTEKAAKLMATRPVGPGAADELSAAMRDASICGLGQAAPNPLLERAKVLPGRTDEAAGTLVTDEDWTMSDSDGQKPAGYGHDQKGAAGGDVCRRRQARRRAHRAGRQGCGQRRRRNRRDLFARRRKSTSARARPSSALAAGSASSFRICATRRSPATGRTAIAASAWSRSRASACWRASCIRKPAAGMKVKTADRPRQDRAPHGARSCSITDQPDADDGARSRLRALEIVRAPEASSAAAFPRATKPAARPQPSRDGGQSRRLHPVQSLRPRLPRGAGQRRDRHGRPRPRREDRVRLRRSDGRLDLRRLRRMRAGLPDRRADAGDAGGREQCLQRGNARPQGRQRLPLLRRRLPAHLSHQGRQAALRQRQERPGEPEPALRQGPLRLRLRQQSAAPDASR